VAYWLQRPGGYLCTRGQRGVTLDWYDGRPTEFIDRVYQRTGRHVHLWFGDKPIRETTREVVLKDDLGNVRTMIEGDERAFVYRWAQGPSNSWRAHTTLTMGQARVAEV
jgi:hypothetical protein